MISSSIKFKAIEDLKKIRAETLRDPLEHLSSNFLDKQSTFKSIEDLNVFLKSLPDKEFEILTEQMLKNLEEEKNQ